MQMRRQSSLYRFICSANKSVHDKNEWHHFGRSLSFTPVACKMPWKKVLVVNNHVKDSSSPDGNGFQWSFKPYIIWMAIFTGIRIDFNAGSTSATSRIGLALYGTFLLMADVFHVYQNAFPFNRLIPIDNMTTADNSIEKKMFISTMGSTIGRLTLSTSYISSLVAFILIHFWIYAVSMTDRWTRLWTTWKRIVLTMQLPIDTYHQIKRRMWIVLVILSLVGIK